MLRFGEWDGDFVVFVEILRDFGRDGFEGGLMESG